jgi:hypothetical protein
MFCSSTTSAAWEDILAGVPSLGQPKVCLPWRGLSRARVRWSSRRWIRRTRSDRPLKAVWPPRAKEQQGAPLGACWPRKGANRRVHTYIPYQISKSKVPKTHQEINQERAPKITTKNKREKHNQALSNHAESSIHTKEVHTRSSSSPDHPTLSQDLTMKLSS